MDLFGNELGRDLFITVCTQGGMDPAMFDKLFEEMVGYQIPEKQITSMRDTRRWEVVSGFQKAIRRGEAEEATRLASALINAGGDAAKHFWRRIPVVAAEDIGFGDVTLVVFTVVAARVYQQKKMAQYEKQVGLFLVDKLSQAPKDRTLCDLAVTKECYMGALDREGIRKALTSDEEEVLEGILVHDTINPESAVGKYLEKEKFRTDELGLFYGIGEALIDGDPVTVVPGKQKTVSPRILGIPSYAYDMHTRVGKTAVRVFSYCEVFKKFFEKTPVKDQAKLVGWVVFYVESEVLDRQIDYPHRKSVYDLSIKAAMVGMGLPWEKFPELYQLVEGNIGRLNGIREHYVMKAYQ